MGTLYGTSSGDAGQKAMTYYVESENHPKVLVQDPSAQTSSDSNTVDSETDRTDIPLGPSASDLNSWRPDLPTEGIPDRTVTPPSSPIRPNKTPRRSKIPSPLPTTPENVIVKGGYGLRGTPRKAVPTPTATSQTSAIGRTIPRKKATPRRSSPVKSGSSSRPSDRAGLSTSGGDVFCVPSQSLPPVPSIPMAMRRSPKFAATRNDDARRIANLETQVAENVRCIRDLEARLPEAEGRDVVRRKERSGEGAKLVEARERCRRALQEQEIRQAERLRKEMLG